MHQEIYDHLVEIARGQALCTYSDIAPLANVDLTVEADRVQLAGYLAEICHHEDQAGRPMLSAIVIHSGGDNNPGNGFFELAQVMGKFNGTMDRVIFWAREVHAVFSAWGPPP